MYYNIAGHILEISGEEPGEIPGFSPFLLESGFSGKPLVSVSLGQKLSLTKGELLYRFTIREGTCRFMKDNGDYIVHWSQSGGPDRLMVIQRNEDKFIVLSDMNQDTDIHILRFSLWIAFGIAALYGRTVAVHASSVIHNERSVLFLGESGTGKSTQSRLWREYISDTELLNDDSPFIRVHRDGTPFVWGSPWSGKTPCYKDKHAPAAALVRLRQSSSNSVRPLRTVEAVGALQPSLPPIFGNEPVLADLMHECMSHTIRQTPVYILDCRPDGEAVELLYDTLIKDGRL